MPATYDPTASVWCSNRNVHKPHPMTLGPEHGPDLDGTPARCTGVTWQDVRDSTDDCGCADPCCPCDGPKGNPVPAGERHWLHRGPQSAHDAYDTDERWA